MTHYPPTDSCCRRNCDRRRHPIRSVVYSLFRGRRKAPRRFSDQSVPCYTDHYPASTLLLVLSIICLCVTDAGFTLLILQNGGIEVNPVMDYLLMQGNYVFFFGKLILTVSGLLVLLIHINFRLLNFIRMQHLLVAVLLGYISLISYQLSLLPNI